jgi:hypothetical protein
MSSTITCNLNCICINSDCLYNHYITYKDRKVVKKFYDEISNKMKDEPKPETRKKNCTFGQLCDKETCGFRHRLSFANREKLIVSYKFNKICPATTETTNKSSNKNEMTKNKSSQNLYLSLDDTDDDINDDINDNVNVNEEKETKEELIKSTSAIKTWVDAVNNTKVNVEVSSLKWEDMADEDFYMTF